MALRAVREGHTAGQGIGGGIAVLRRVQVLGADGEALRAFPMQLLRPLHLGAVIPGVAGSGHEEDGARTEVHLGLETDAVPAAVGDLRCENLRVLRPRELDRAFDREPLGLPAGNVLLVQFSDGLPWRLRLLEQAFTLHHFLLRRHLA